MEAPRAAVGGEAVPIIDAERYPIHCPASPAYARLVETCRHELATAHAVNLPGFVLEVVRVAMVGELAPLSALALANRKQSGYHLAHLTPDQLDASLLVERLFRWPPLAQFIGAVTGWREMHTMADPFQAHNVICAAPLPSPPSPRPPFREWGGCAQG